MEKYVDCNIFTKIKNTNTDCPRLNEERCQSCPKQGAKFKKSRAEVRHFTTDQKTTEDTYGYTWHQVVREYLKNGYKGENSQHDIVVLGVTYKVLKRGEVTVFYDSDGNTLFDVENARLAAEYDCLIQIPEDETENCVFSEVKDHTDTIGTASSTDIATGDVPTPIEEELEVAKVENAKSVRERAKDKLEAELKKAKDKSFVEPIIKHLLKRCEEDNGLSADVIQEHKAWDKCIDYIYAQAKKQATGNRCVVRDDVVYEWAEDYYHKADKAEEAAKKKAEHKKCEVENSKNDKVNKDKKKPSEKQENNMKGSTKNTKWEEKKEFAKQKRSSKELDGQMDLFSMMGL